MKRLGIVLFVAAASMFAMAASVGTGASASEGPHKVFVCKYVGTPGVDERLQTGDNPISVDVHAIPEDPVVIGSSFADAQGRSYVLAFDVGQPEPDASACPGGPEPTTTSSSSSTSTSTSTTEGTTTSTTTADTTTSTSAPPETTTSTEPETTTTHPGHEDTTTTSSPEEETTTSTTEAFVPGEGSARRLAETGSSAGMLIAIGVALLALGLVAIRAALKPSER